MTRLGLVLDQVIQDYEGALSTDEAFGLFVEEVARPYFDRIDFCSRVKSASAPAPYALDQGFYDVVSLPWYRDVVQLCARGPRLLPEIGRKLSAAMERWDLLIVGGIHPIAPLALRLARRGGLPAILWIRGSYYDVLSHRLGRNPLRWAFGMTAAAAVLRAIPSGTTIVSSGRDDYRFLRRMGPTHLVYTSKFGLADFAPLPRAARAPGAGPGILYVGRIAPEKGLEVLLEAFESIVRSWSGPPPTLSFAGFDFHGSSYAEEFHRKVQLSPVGRYVRFLGLVPYGRPLFDLYDAHDVFALSSHTEGFPQVLLESMARGLPIVSTAVGGIPKLVRNGVDGILVLPRRPDELATALTSVLNDSVLASRLALEGQATAKAYTREAQLASLCEFIDSTFPGAGFVRRRAGLRDADLARGGHRLAPADPARQL